VFRLNSGCVLFDIFIFDKNKSKRIPSIFKDESTGSCIRGLLEKYPTFGREKETGLLGALDT
jgi:hypothetical protein